MTGAEKVAGNNWGEFHEYFSTATANIPDVNQQSQMSYVTTGVEYTGGPYPDQAALILRATKPAVEADDDAGIVAVAAVPPNAKLVTDLLTQATLQREKLLQKAKATGTAGFLMIKKHLAHDVQVHLESNPEYIAANTVHPKDDSTRSVWDISQSMIFINCSSDIVKDVSPLVFQRIPIMKWEVNFFQNSTQ